MDNEVRSIMTMAGMFVFLYGWIGQLRALFRHRAPNSNGPWFDWRPRLAKRDWFATEYGHRMYRWAGWNTLIGGTIMLVARLL